MTRTQGAIPRWLSLANLLAIFITLAIVIPKQVHAASVSAPVPAPHDLSVRSHTDPADAWLDWQDDSRTTTTAYILERSTTSDFSSDSVSIRISKNTLDYIDETQTYNTTFYYRVYSLVGETMSPPSNVVTNRTWSRTRPYAPWAPYNVTVSRDTTNNGLLVQWSSNAGNETGIWVWRSSDNGTTWETRASLTFGSTSYFDNDPPEAAPIYQIVNFNDGGIASSEAVQYLDPYVQTPGVASLVPSNITQYIPSNITSVVPSNVTTVTGIASAAGGIVSNVNDAVPIAQSLLSNETGIISPVQSDIGNVTSNLGAVGSIPASLESVEQSDVASVESNVANIGKLESSIETIPSAEESFVFNEQPKIWVGNYDNFNKDWAQSLWLLPISCFGTSACPAPANSPDDVTTNFSLHCEKILAQYTECYYYDPTPGPPPHS
ncbi:MAG: fibronectin type III domain-containing protein [Actinomycetota bacterium]